MLHFHEKVMSNHNTVEEKEQQAPQGAVCGLFGLRQARRSVTRDVLVGVSSAGEPMPPSEPSGSHHYDFNNHLIANYHQRLHQALLPGSLSPTTTTTQPSGDDDDDEEGGEQQERIHTATADGMTASRTPPAVQQPPEAGEATPYASVHFYCFLVRSLDALDAILQHRIFLFRRRPLSPTASAIVAAAEEVEEEEVVAAPLAALLPGGGIAAGPGETNPKTKAKGGDNFRTRDGARTAASLRRSHASSAASSVSVSMASSASNAALPSAATTATSLSPLLSASPGPSPSFNSSSSTAALLTASTKARRAPPPQSLDSLLKRLQAAREAYRKKMFPKRTKLLSSQREQGAEMDSRRPSVRSNSTSFMLERLTVHPLGTADATKNGPQPPQQQELLRAASSATGGSTAPSLHRPPFPPPPHAAASTPSSLPPASSCASSVAGSTEPQLLAGLPYTNSVASPIIISSSSSSAGSPTTPNVSLTSRPSGEGALLGPSSVPLGARSPAPSSTSRRLLRHHDGTAEQSPRTTSTTADAAGGPPASGCFATPMASKAVLGGERAEPDKCLLKARWLRESSRHASSALAAMAASGSCAAQQQQQQLQRAGTDAGLGSLLRDSLVAAGLACAREGLRGYFTDLYHASRAAAGESNNNNNNNNSFFCGEQDEFCCGEKAKEVPRDGRSSHSSFALGAGASATGVPPHEIIETTTLSGNATMMGDEEDVTSLQAVEKQHKALLAALFYEHTQLPRQCPLSNDSTAAVNEEEDGPTASGPFGVGLRSGHEEEVQQLSCRPRHDAVVVAERMEELVEEMTAALRSHWESHPSFQQTSGSGGGSARRSIAATQLAVAGAAANRRRRQPQPQAAPARREEEAMLVRATTAGAKNSLCPVYASRFLRTAGTLAAYEAGRTSMQEIVDGLWCGSYHPATNYSFLKEMNITHICICMGTAPRFPGEFEYIVLDAEDNESFNIRQYFDETFDFIDKGLQRLDQKTIVKAVLQRVCGSRRRRRQPPPQPPQRLATAEAARETNSPSSSLGTTAAAAHELSQLPESVQKTVSDLRSAEDDEPGWSSSSVSPTSTQPCGVLLPESPVPSADSACETPVVTRLPRPSTNGNCAAQTNAREEEDDDDNDDEEEEARERAPGGVLIHCGAGISRAPTITAAYLMRKFKISSTAAIHLIKERRPYARPNNNFTRQLQAYHKELVAASTTSLTSLADAPHSPEKRTATTLLPPPSTAGVQQPPPQRHDLQEVGGECSVPPTNTTAAAAQDGGTSAADEPRSSSGSSGLPTVEEDVGLPLPLGPSSVVSTAPPSPEFSQRHIVVKRKAVAAAFELYIYIYIYICWNKMNKFSLTYRRIPCGVERELMMMMMMMIIIIFDIIDIIIIFVFIHFTRCRYNILVKVVSSSTISDTHRDGNDETINLLILFIFLLYPPFYYRLRLFATRGPGLEEEKKIKFYLFRVQLFFLLPYANPLHFFSFVSHVQQSVVLICFALFPPSSLCDLLQQRPTALKTATTNNEKRKAKENNNNR
eukprot:gene1933-1172_t